MPRARHNIAVAVLVTTGTLGGGIALSRTLELGPYHTPQPTVSQSLIDQRVEDLAEQRRSFMVGVYNARSCFGPLELATLEPAAGEEDEGWQPNTETSYHYND